MKTLQITLVGLFFAMDLAAAAPYEPFLLRESVNKSVNQENPLEPNTFAYTVKSLELEDINPKSLEFDQKLPNIKPESDMNSEPDPHLKPVIFKSVRTDDNKADETKDGMVFAPLKPATDTDIKSKDEQEKNKINDLKRVPAPSLLPSELQMFFYHSFRDRFKNNFLKNFVKKNDLLNGADVQITGSYKYEFTNGETEEYSYNNRYDGQGRSY